MLIESPTVRIQTRRGTSGPTPTRPRNSRPINNRPLGAPPARQFHVEQVHVFDLFLTLLLATVGALFFVAFLFFVTAGDWPGAAMATFCWLVAYAAIWALWSA